MDPTTSIPLTDSQTWLPTFYEAGPRLDLSRPGPPRSPSPPEPGSPRAPRVWHPESTRGSGRRGANGSRRTSPAEETREDRDEKPGKHWRRGWGAGEGALGRKKLWLRLPLFCHVSQPRAPAPGGRTPVTHPCLSCLPLSPGSIVRPQTPVAPAGAPPPPATRGRCAAGSAHARRPGPGWVWRLAVSGARGGGGAATWSLQPPVPAAHTLGSAWGPTRARAGVFHSTSGTCGASIC